MTRIALLLTLGALSACGSAGEPREPGTSARADARGAAVSRSGSRTHGKVAHGPGSESGGSAAQIAKSASEPKELTDFFGAGYPPALADTDRGHGHIGSKSWGTWIQPKPDSRSLPLGGIRIGASLPLIGPPVRSGLGRCQEYAPVELGFVCVGKRSTLDMNAPFMRAHRWTTPRPGPFPYEYAFSVGAPMLTAIPKPEQVAELLKTGERDYRALRGWAVGHDELAVDEPIEPNGPVPEFLQNGGHAPMAFSDDPHIYFKKIPFGSMLAYTRAFEANGEVYVLSTNMTIVPARGLKRFRPSEFRGVKLGGKAQLPLAWTRGHARPQFRRGADGHFEPTGKEWPPRVHFGLTGQELKQGSDVFLETRDGAWVKSEDVSVARVRDKLPYEVRQEPQKWIHVRVTQGLLTLYDGAKPVFSTLTSPGKEGATPYGTFRILNKEHVSTMTTEMGEPRKFWIADVPWTMYFKRPYAIHGAFWHEDFGMKKSGGCVNLSPIDAKYVYDWVSPSMPEGWGMVEAYQMGGGTLVVIEA